MDHLYTLHYSIQDHRILSARVNVRPEDAVEAWGGEFVP